MDWTRRVALSDDTKARISRLAAGVPFRLAVAVFCLAAHLGLSLAAGTRFEVPWNWAPNDRPGFVDPAHEANPHFWNRLVVARWDAGQYIELGLRGYQYCGPKGQYGPRGPSSPSCNLSFYPSYGVVGRVVAKLTGAPIDYALLAVSLLSSLVFLFMWTGPMVVERLGRLETWLALLAFNVFTTAFALVTIQTEPLTLALTLGAYVAFRRRLFLLAGFLAGGATSMRITAVAVGAACGLALLIETWRNRPSTPRDWARRVVAILLCGWGVFALWGYHAYRFGDALAYIHAHAAGFHHEPSLLKLLFPAPIWLMLAIEHPLHEGVWLAGSLLWFLLGARETLKRFEPAEAAFWVVLFFGTILIAGAGLVTISFVGMNRYLLLALPLFFVIGVLGRKHPLAFAFWIILSAWHYWHVDLCIYTGGPGNHALDVCNMSHWIGRI